MNPSARRRGASLIELIVTIALLAITAAISTMAARRFDVVDHDDPLAILTDSLTRAAAESRDITIRIFANGRSLAATVGADGSIRADSGFAIGRLKRRSPRAP